MAHADRMARFNHKPFDFEHHHRNNTIICDDLPEIAGFSFVFYSICSTTNNMITTMYNTQTSHQISIEGINNHTESCFCGISRNTSF